MKKIECIFQFSSIISLMFVFVGCVSYPRCFVFYLLYLALFVVEIIYPINKLRIFIGNTLLWAATFLVAIEQRPKAKGVNGAVAVEEWILRL